MNQDQLLSLARAVMQVTGTVLTTVGVGGITDSSWSTITGGVLVLISLIWGNRAHSESGTVAAADRLAKDPDSAVKGVIVAPTVAGVALAKSMESPTVAPAGSARADAIAQK
jgi:hypothetical protein